MAEALDSLILRAAALDDAPGLCELANLPNFRHGTLRLPYQTVDQTRAWLKGLTDASVELVADSDGLIVGSAGLACQAGRRRHVGLIGIGVHDGWQGRGVGTRLMQALIEIADDWLDLRRLELIVYADNDRAIGLYERLGFVREGLMRAHSFRAGHYVDSLVMARLRGLLPAP